MAHAHVQGGVVMIGKAPLRRVQLVRRDPDVQEHPICSLNPSGLCQLPHLGKIPLHPDGLWVGGQPLSRRPHGVGVLVDGQELSCGEPLQNRLRVAPATHGAVNVDPLWLDRQGFYRLVKQDGLVVKFHTVVFSVRSPEAS